MVIGILTFSKEVNYGATLQCYALCEVFKSLGHDVKIIDLQLNRFPESLVTKIAVIPKHFLFRLFRFQYLKYTHHYKNIDDIKKHLPYADLYVVGSDQVWNPEITKRLDPLAYFFSFLPDKAKRISYAASFGFSEWRFPEFKTDIKELLGKFHSISVREESGVDICRNTFGMDAVCVLDPTLLLTNYDNICGPYDDKRKIKRVAYFKFNRDWEVLNVAKDFADRHNLEISYINYFHRLKGFVYHPYSTVKGWLNAIRYSEFIITDSFHFTVFSILFHKKFVTVPSFPGREGRMKNLLEKLGLIDNFCKNTEELKERIDSIYLLEHDWQAIDNLLSKLRSESMTFIKNSLK